MNRLISSMKSVALCRPPAAVLLIVLMSAAALSPSFASGAVPSYSFQETFSTGTNPVFPFGPCTVRDLDIDSEENVYVLCGGPADINGSGGTILKRFDKNGTPLAWSHAAPYIAANAIIENPHPDAPERNDQPYGRRFVGQNEIAIDKSGGATDGYIYINQGPGVQIFDSSGRWLGIIAGILPEGLDVGPNGNLVIDVGGVIRIYNPAWTVIKQINFQGQGSTSTQFGEQNVTVDSTGAVWGIAKPLDIFGFRTVSKFEADQYTEPELTGGSGLGNRRKADFSPFVDIPLKPFGSPLPVQAASLAIDLDDDSLYMLRATPPGILHFSGGDETEEAHQLSGVIGTAAQVGGGLCGIGSRSCDDGLAFAQDSKTLFVAEEAGVSKFVAGSPVPSVVSDVVDVADIGHTEATVRAEVQLDGGGPIEDCVVMYGPTRGYGSTAPCSPDPAAGAPGSHFTEDTEVTAELTGLSTGSTYHYAFVATNADGEGLGVDRTVRPAAVLNVKTEAATDITDEAAMLHGTLNPDGIDTTYYFEYGLRGELTEKTPVSVVLSGSGTESVSVPISNLQAGGEYSYRIVARNELGSTGGETRIVNVAGPPKVIGVRATDVAAGSATLNARINPGGYSTSYHFEYGLTTEYGSSIPVPPAQGDAGNGESFSPVAENLSGLEPGRTYHFRVVAMNEWGSTASDNTTFYFAPQPCPNERVRQITKSSYLPDCRAYELVSPANAGSVQIYPGNEIYKAEFFGNLIPVRKAREIQNTGLAESPGRFMYYGGLGVVEGMDAPNVGLDSYVATRTLTGWETTFPGIKGSEYGQTGRKVCSIGLDLCLDHFFKPSSGVPIAEPENSGHLFDVSGEKRGHYPSNVKSIPGGQNFNGDWQISPHLTHLAFSSRDVAFAAGGLTQAPGSAYVNDIESHEISLISRLPNGEPIGLETGDAQEFITFAPKGISNDGSRILMRTKATDGPHRLFMRVDDAVTYDISNGAGVHLIGMTGDGTRVLFYAGQQLTDEDTDRSGDIYLWRLDEGGSPTLRVISQGNGQGDADDCDASWTARCSVGVLKTERGDRSGEGPISDGPYQNVTMSGIDSNLARGNGAVYFFAPEVLDDGAPRNAKNLYLARDGEVQYVTTFKAADTIDRLQISPDGRFAGFVTNARLTPYDNDGFKQMYSYDAEQGKLVCVSCRPSGEAPTVDVEASQNGPFMSDDGRVFFTTSDQLVPADADAFRIPDVYEYVEGRPQLISSGVSRQAVAPGGALFFINMPLGLESVSASGVDVYFSTTDTLVPQDENGSAVKIYNARTNGGFEPPKTEVPCVAADECHGAGAPDPLPLRVGTGSPMAGGNLQPRKARARKRCGGSPRNRKSRKKCRKGRRSKLTWCGKGMKRAMKGSARCQRTGWKGR